MLSLIIQHNLYLFFFLYLQLKNANNAAKSTAVTNARLDIKPIIADKSERHPNDKPNGIST
jgi:hypothetical protein